MQSFRFDYSRTMLMKMGIALPDNKGGCVIFNTFEQALEKIKAIDALTLGAPKIIYLVGWQYLGHDDKYPAFFEVNEHVKRPCDQTARDSLLWLIKEARQYHTTVSLHINLSDAYPDSPLWDTYVQNDLILKDALGRLKPTGTWNERTAYQVRFAAEYKSGLFQERVDRLFDLVPLAEIGTVHVDAFFVRKGKGTTIRTEKAYRRKMVQYFMERGVDVTSEFIYREWNCGYRSLWGSCDLVGLIPAVWNLRMTQKDYFRYPPQLLAGGRLADGIQWDKDLQYLFYGNTHGEQSFNKKDWVQDFTEEFALGSVLYLYLNQYKLQRITGAGKYRKALFSDGVATAIHGRSIAQNGQVLKDGDTLCIPVSWKNDTYYAWSKQGGRHTLFVPLEKAAVFRITPQGSVFLEQAMPQNGSLTLQMEAGAAYAIKKDFV